jgi:hypothetical protein
MGKYLDKTGLSAFWQKIKDTFAKKSDIPDSYTKDESDTKYLPTVSFVYNGPRAHTVKSVYDLIIESAPNGQCFLNITGYLTFSGYISIRYMGAYQIQMMDFGNSTYVSNIYSGSDAFDTVINSLASSGGDYLPLSGGSITGNIDFQNDQGIVNTDNKAGFGFNDSGEPTIVNGYGRYISIGTDYFAGDYINYYFPDLDGTVMISKETASYEIGKLTLYETLEVYSDNDSEIIVGHSFGDHDIDATYSARGIRIYDNDGSGSNREYHLCYPAYKSGTFALTNDFKTINGQSIIGSGNIEVSNGGSGWELVWLGNSTSINVGSLNGRINGTDTLEYDYIFICYGESGEIEFRISGQTLTSYAMRSDNNGESYFLQIPVVCDENFSSSYINAEVYYENSMLTISLQNNIRFYKMYRLHDRDFADEE